MGFGCGSTPFWYHLGVEPVLVPFWAKYHFGEVSSPPIGMVRDLEPWPVIWQTVPMDTLWFPAVRFFLAVWISFTWFSG